MSSSKVERIGLFGGSFDPIHMGHLLVAQAAIEELALDWLFFIPTAQSPFKPESAPAPAAIRLKMLRLALAGRTAYSIDEQEIVRGGISYTIDSVRHYRKRYPAAAFHYLIGADHLAQLPRWREAGELARLTDFAVVQRPGDRAGEIPAPFRGCFLRGFPLALSSSQVRRRIQTGKSIVDLVPPAVAEVILNDQLYLKPES